jgi:response regulator RpfG family c-di-GMP phosphodiesterase
MSEHQHQQNKDVPCLREEVQAGQEAPSEAAPVWKLLIVDPEQDWHLAAAQALAGKELLGRKLQLLSADSAEEAKQQLRDHPDTAVVLLEVVLDKKAADLDLIQAIRSELGLSLVRVVVCTGHPELAPEEQLILQCDIHDYKEKATLTAQRLLTTLIASLRSYRDLISVEESKRGLEQVIQSTSELFQHQSFGRFAPSVLKHYAKLAQPSFLLSPQAEAGGVTSYAVVKAGKHLELLAINGEFNKCGGRPLEEQVPAKVLERIRDAFRSKQGGWYGKHAVAYFGSKSGAEQVIYLQDLKQLTEWSRYLIDIFSSNVSVALENIHLSNEIENTQREIIFSLGEIAETRSRETGFHVKRVSEYSYLLAEKLGLPESECDMLRMASPMHDVGKVGIPDAILNKPGKLDPEEFEIMKTHATAGYEMLRHSDRPIMKTAAVLALQHHEKYNGTGYPNRLFGESIHLYGRITAIADVFDALGSDRVYKKAWELERILELFRRERGEHFDPQLTDLFFDHLPEFLQIRDAYSDTKVF